MKNYFKVFFISCVFAFAIYSLLRKDHEDNDANYVKEVNDPIYKYGILVDTFSVSEQTVKKGQTLGKILFENHIGYPLIDDVVKKSKGIFDFSKIKIDDPYTLISSNDTNETLKYFIYEPDKTTYIVLDFSSNPKVYAGKHKVITKLKLSSGKINSSLSQSVIDQGIINDRLVENISEIYAWTVDFFKIQVGDSWKVFYENKYLEDGKYIGIGKIIAAEFTHKNENFYSFYFEDKDNYGEHFDEEGKTLRKAFLKAPLNFYRISSRYSKNRKHPVTGQWKGHFGTDYAAPKGTPIMSTANGTIVTASFTRNNGNYVKVRHNGTYSTQYLHMSKIKRGIKKGVYVKQGDIIGYVGSTGLATGPHVCYRFWKNGKQVDPYKQKLPPGDPIRKENKSEYMFVKDSLMNILNSNI